MVEKISAHQIDVLDLKSAQIFINIEDKRVEVLLYTVDNYNDLQIRVSFDQDAFKSGNLKDDFELYNSVLSSLHDQYEELHKEFLEAIWEWYFNYLKTELPILVYKNDDGTELEILSTKDGWSNRPLIRKNEAFMARFANVVEITFIKGAAVPLQGYLLKPIAKSLTGGFIKETYKGAKSRQVKSITSLDLLSDSYTCITREMSGVDD